MEKHVDHRQILDNIPVVSMRLNYEHNRWHAWYVSRDIEKYGYAPEEFLDDRVTWEDILHPDDRVVARKLAHDYMERRLDDFRLQYRILTRRGESVWIAEYSHVNRDADGNVLCVDSLLLNRTDDKLNADMTAERVQRQRILTDILLSLHDADLEMALQIILDRTGAYLDVSRALLFQDSPDHRTCKVVYEWLNKGIAPIKDLGRAVDYEEAVPEVYAALRQTGFLLASAGEIPENCRAEFEREGLVSSAVFAVYLHGEHYGFVCFDDCVIPRVWDEDTANFLKSISNLISTVLMRLHTEEHLKVTRRTCETVLDNIDSYIFAANPDTDEIVFANRAFRNAFGSECVGKKASDYLSMENAEPRAQEAPPPSRQSALDTREEYSPRTGQWLSITRELVRWVDGRTVFLVNCYDITVKRQYEENIRRLAYTDYLTGLPNRYHCDADLAESIARATRAGRPGYLLFVDLDDFKIINDCYGHDFGDGVLVALGEFLGGLFSGDNRVFRFGGDEFVVIVNHGDGAGIRDLLETMLERAKQPWRSHEREFYCSLSIGVVEFPREGADPTSILKKADIAMYQAKRAGKNNYIFYTEGLDSATIERSEMESLLRDAMQDDMGGFEVYYQPYSDTAENRIVGAEALIRMRGRDGSLLLAEQFIPLAEYLGIIGPLGEFVLERAAAQCRAVNDGGRPDFTMNVNLSARQFKQKDIIHRLDTILRKSGVEYRNIVISVNESVALGELERMLGLCGQLRNKGVQVALDDFGSGGASFINMRSLPVDMVKVSSKFVDEIDDRFTGYFLRLITDLSHFTGKTVCMNGVETVAQFESCRKFGIDLVQGFYLHRPGDDVELMERLEVAVPPSSRRRAASDA